jgi:hypothetical protein
VDAIEIHTTNDHTTGTTTDRFASFEKLWTKLGGSILKVLSISLQDTPPVRRTSKNSLSCNDYDSSLHSSQSVEKSIDTISFMRNLFSLISQHPHWSNYTGVLLWQADGRPMSGDIGKGSTHATIQFTGKLLQVAQTEIDDNIAEEELNAGTRLFTGDGTRGKVFIQPAGGANQLTMPLIKEETLTDSNREFFGGVAFGGYARKSISKWLSHFSKNNASFHVEDYPQEYEQCMKFVDDLIATVKSS